MKATTFALLFSAAVAVGCQSDSTTSPSANNAPNSSNPNTGMNYSNPNYPTQANSNQNNVNPNGDNAKGTDVNGSTANGYSAPGATSVTTYSTTSTTQPDNTAINARDRDNNALTADKAGQTRTDIEVTAAIRRGIMDRKLSITAENVKIITQNGHVTLRGPVNNPDEKQTIGKLASDIAGPDNVDNQLDVAMNDQGAAAQ